MNRSQFIQETFKILGIAALTEKIKVVNFQDGAGKYLASLQPNWVFLGICVANGELHVFEDGKEVFTKKIANPKVRSVHGWVNNSDGKTLEKVKKTWMTAVINNDPKSMHRYNQKGFGFLPVPLT